MKKLLLFIILFWLSINLANALSESEQIIAANYLALNQKINDFSGATSEYRINDNISRKEVMKIIINKLLYVDWAYKCEWKFKDVLDDWGCKYIEKALNEWYIEKQESFRPDASITISETLKLIFKAKKINKTYNTWNWGKDYIDSAYDLWWIYDKDIDWNLEAKRWFIFLTLANAEYNFESYQEWKIEFKENKTDFYWIDFNLKTINSNKYELIWENIPSDVNSIEILSCKENFSDTYDSNWYNLKSFKNWNSSFKYTIDKNFNNYCPIPYKVKLNYISWEVKTVELNLNLTLFRKFTDKIIWWSGFVEIVNLNTLKKLDNSSMIVLLDKNNLYLYYAWWPEWYALYYKIEDYLSYKIIWNILVWDNYAYDSYWKKLFKIDWNSFEVYWTWYYKDNDNYYFWKSGNLNLLFLIWNNNKNLDILSETVYNYDWKYYYYDKEFEVWNKDTFKIVNNTWTEIGYWLLTYRIFAKDKDNIYLELLWYWSIYYDKFKWDYDTYKVVQSEFNKSVWIDKYSIYYPLDNWGLKQYFYSFDLDSFKMEDDNLFSDKNWEYYLDEEKWIISFDKESFKNIDDSIMYDKNKVYLWGKEINIDPKDFEIIDSKLNILRIKDKLFVINPNYMPYNNFLWENNSNTFLLELADYLNWKTNTLKTWNIYENVEFDTLEKISDNEYKDKNKIYKFY